jgi:hypothetical protein
MRGWTALHFAGGGGGGGGGGELFALTLHSFSWKMQFPAFSIEVSHNNITTPTPKPKFHSLALQPFALQP